MEIPENIITSAKKSIQDMEEFFKITHPHTLSKKLCELYLDNIFGCTQEFKIGYSGKIQSVYIGDNDGRRHWGQFLVRLYFPIEGICLVCSMEKGLTIPPIAAALSGNMKERITLLSYYDGGLKTVMPSCYILGTTLTTEMIVFPDGLTLKEKIKKDTYIFG